VKYKSRGTLPERTLDTMSDAIALSSPSGRMSKRARKAAEDRLRQSLFGDSSCTREDIQGTAPQPSERNKLLAQAGRLRELASRGMCVRKYTKEADRLEALAKEMK
jgi:hypothetical protein